MLNLRKWLDDGEDKGFILVVVMGAALLLALMAAGFAAAVRTHISAAASAVELSRAEAFADGGINLALLDLVAGHQDATYESRFPANGRASGCRANSEAWLVIRIADEAGKIDLNTAGEPILNAFFAGLGASTDQSSPYVDRILDFRDGDGNTRPHGAEQAEYKAAGRSFGPKDNAFDTVDELDQVLGLPADLISRVKTFATVHSGLAGIDASVASSELLAILDAASLNSTAGELTSGSVLSGDSQVSGKFAARSNQRAYSIHALARMASGVQYVSQAIVEFPIRSGPGYAIRQWRRGSADDADGLPVADELDLPPC